MNNQNRITYSQLGTEFIYKVYGWMSAGLSITAAASYIFAHSALAPALFVNKGLLVGLSLIEIGLVIVLGAFAERLSYVAMSAAFIVYSFLTGITLSSIFLVYTSSSIIEVFLTCSAMFAGLAIWGYSTKRDLSTVGSVSMGALFGLILASFVNIFFRSSILSFGLSIMGILVFSALTMYDMQKIKQLSSQFLSEGEAANKIAILCGLTLYLDFINLFLSLLRIFGQQRNRD